MSFCQAKFTYVWRNITWTVRRYPKSFVSGTGLGIGCKHAAFQVRSEMLPKLYKHWCRCVLWLCLISHDASRSSSDLSISVITTLRSPWFVRTGRTNEQKYGQGCNHLHCQDQMHSTGNVSIAEFCTRYTSILDIWDPCALNFTAWVHNTHGQRFSTSIMHKSSCQTLRSLLKVNIKVTNGSVTFQGIDNVLCEFFTERVSEIKPRQFSTRFLRHLIISLRVLIYKL